MAEWISVKDRLPENDDDVLLCFNTGVMVVGFRSNYDELCAHIDEEYYANCKTCPTHWMPLPEPPKEE